MPEIKFSSEKAERWLVRIEKRLGVLTSEQQALYKSLKEAHSKGKLNPIQARELWTLERSL